MSETLRKNGQTSVEFLVVLSTVLVVFIILLAMGQKSYISSKEAVKSIQARATLKDIVNAANLVHSQGENAKTKVYVTMPEDVQEIILSDNCVFMRFYIGDEIHEKHECSDACLVGEVPTYSGSYWINMQSRRNCVYIGEPKLKVNPTSLNFAVYID
ncbi:MAG: hypothetical protein JW778_03605 [Candidatus Altiarchaeota archaeon]|nr:hypothetical protein [Candidatus Altiarchaeota archaeon]